MEQENFIFRFYGAVIQNDVAKYFSIIIIIYFLYALLKINSDNPKDNTLVNSAPTNLSTLGILGTFFYLIFCLSCLVKVFDNLIINYNKRSLEIKLSTLIILLLLMRSILETSFAVFSIDFIVISTFFIFIKNKELLKKNGE
mgnify:CR=1 FL=1